MLHSPKSSHSSVKIWLFNLDYSLSSPPFLNETIFTKFIRRRQKMQVKCHLKTIDTTKMILFYYQKHYNLTNSTILYNSEG